MPGICLIIVGVTGDVRNWWDDLGYTSNVLAGATGACFGIPLALFVIQRLLNDREQERLRTELTQQRQTLTARLKAAVSAIKQEACIRAIGAVMLNVTQCYTSFQYIRSSLAESENPKSDVINAAVPRFEALHESLSWLLRVSPMSSHDLSDAISGHRAEAEASWRRLHDYVYPKCMEVGIVTPALRSVEGIDSWMRALLLSAAFNLLTSTDRLETWLKYLAIKERVPNINTYMETGDTRELDGLPLSNEEVHSLDLYRSLETGARHKISPAAFEWYDNTFGQATKELGSLVSLFLSVEEL